MEAKKGRSRCMDPERGDGFDGWWEDRSPPRKILVGAGFGILGVGLLFLFGRVVMLLWNRLMPDNAALRRGTG